MVSRASVSTQTDFLSGERQIRLPVQLTTFVGRERESIEVIRLLETTRLLTLVGTGGIGKTRLALEVGQALADTYDDGVRFVDLAPISDPALVLGAVATALGLQDIRNQPLAETLTSFIRSRHLLLVLDNCEHVLAAAASVCELVLRGANEVRVLATSRQPLAIHGESLCRVPPLAVPDLRSRLGTDEIGASEGVRLFCQRAQSVQPNFVLHDLNAAAVAQVCHRLDGMPLAIELAAAHVRLLTPQQILARLDDRLRLLVGGSRTAPTRHQTLRATLDWSYALLEENERALLRRLAVFGGGWSLEAAEAVGCGDCISSVDVLELLEALVDRSLVVVEMEPRTPQAHYRLLETVRQYALEKLREADEEPSVLRRHAAWYSELMERAEPRLIGPHQAGWLDRIEREHDNLRAALGWAREADVETGLQIAAVLGRFWSTRGHFVEGQSWLTGLLAAQGQRTRRSARALLTLGRLAFQAGDAEGGMAAVEESLQLFSDYGDRRGAGDALLELALIYVFRGEYARSGELAGEALQIFRAENDRYGTGWALARIGGIARTEGNVHEAASLFEEALNLLRPGGDPDAIGYTLNSLGQLARARGDYATANRFLEQSLALFRSIGATSRVGWTLGCLSCVALSQNNLDHAERLLDEARLELEGIGDRQILHRGLWVAGVLAVKRGQFARGVRMFAAGAASPRVWASLDPDEHQAWDGCLAVARAKLGTPAFDQAWAEGQAMTLEEAIAYGLTREQPTAVQKPHDVMALTQREREVAALIAEGCSNREIAERLVISERTAEAHVSNLLSKIGVRSRAQLAVWLMQNPERQA